MKNKALILIWLKRNKKNIVLGISIISILIFMLVRSFNVDSISLEQQKGGSDKKQLISTKNQSSSLDLLPDNVEKMEQEDKKSIDLTSKILDTVVKLAWPIFWLIIFFAVIKEVKEILPRVKKLKAGAGGFEASVASKVVISAGDVEKKEEQITDEIYKQENKDKTKKEVEQPITLEEWRNEMFFAAFVKKDKTRTIDAYKHITELNDDELSLKKDKIEYLELLHRLGDTNSILQLKELLSDPSVLYEVNTSLGYCYENSDDLEKAALFYSEAARESKNNDEKSLAVKRFSAILYRDNKKEQAINVISEALTVIRDDLFKARLYEALAEIYDKEKDYENKAFVIEKAVELKPNDAALLFKAGYSYAECKYDELSLLHYKNAKEINPKDDAVQNNIGVQYDNLKMPIKSIASYKEAEELGNTLASANLAYRFLQIGFVIEAKNILNIAKEKEIVHPNVNAALSEVPEKIEKENETEKEQIKSALLLRKFILNYAEAKFVKNSSIMWNMIGNLREKFLITVL